MQAAGRWRGGGVDCPCESAARGAGPRVFTRGDRGSVASPSRPSSHDTVGSHIKAHATLNSTARTVNRLFPPLLPEKRPFIGQPGRCSSPLLSPNAHSRPVSAANLILCCIYRSDQAQFPAGAIRWKRSCRRGGEGDSAGNGGGECGDVHLRG